MSLPFVEEYISRSRDLSYSLLLEIAVAHLAKSFAPFMASLDLGSLSLWASLEFVVALLIASIRTSGSSEMHLKAVTPRMGRWINECLFLPQPSQPHQMGGELSPQRLLPSDFLS